MWLSCVCEEATAPHAVGMASRLGLRSLRPNERFEKANLIANLGRNRRSLATALRPNERFGMANLIANLGRSRRSLATALTKRRNQI